MALQTFTYTSYCSSGSKATRYGVQLEVIENSVSGNNSNVTVNFYLGGAGALGLKTDYTGSSFSGYSCTGKIFVNNVQKVSTSGSKTVNNSTKVLLATWTDNIAHNSDGSLTIPIRGEFSGGLSTQASGGTASGTPTFTKIARASTITCPDTNIGASATVTITKADSSFTHTLTYSFADGTITGTIATATTSATPSFTVPTTLYAKIPNGTEISGTITCITLSGTEEVGRSTCSIKAKVPTTAKPTCAAPTITDSDTVSKNTIGLYVVGKSKPTFNMTNCFASSYSATFSKLDLTVDGVQVYSGSEKTFTMTTPITKTSTSYSIVVYDSRGIPSDARTGTITAYAYSNPVGTIKADRDATTTTKINYTYSATITNINSNNKNAHGIKVEYKASTASTWTTLVNNTTDYSKGATTGSVTGLSDSTSYDFRITVTDSYNTAPTPVTTQVGSSFVLMDFKADGSAMAIGKSSTQQDVLEVAMVTDFTKPMRLKSEIHGTTLSGGGGTAGYMKAFTLTTTGTYQNQVMTFDIIQRGRYGRLKIHLNSSNTAGTLTIYATRADGNINVYYTSESNVMTVYIQKSEGWDNIEVTLVEKSNYMKATKITWNDETVAELPSGYVVVPKTVGSFSHTETAAVTSGSTSLVTSGAVYNATNTPVTNADAGCVKFPNGFMIAWVKKTVTTSVTSWGSVYYSDHAMGDWSTAFTKLFSVFPSIGSGSGTLYWAGCRDATTTSAGTLRAFRATNANASIDIYITAIGMWK